MAKTETAPEGRGASRVRSSSRFARPKTRRPRTSPCSICGRRPGSPITSSSARAPTRGRCAPSPTRSSRRWRDHGESRRTSKATTAPTIRWILLDYFDFIVHVFAPETRALLRPRAALGQRRARGHPARDLSWRRLGASPPATTSSRVVLAAALRGVRRAARPPDARSGLRRLLAVDPAAHAAALRALRRSAADVARASACRWPAVRRAAAAAGRPSIARAAVGAYDGALRAIVHALKYDGRRSLARPLAALMRSAVRRRARGRRLPGPGAAAPVAAARARIQPGADLARRLSVDGLPVCAALRRVRATPTQTGLPAAQRHRNVRDAFAPRRRAARAPRYGARWSCWSTM